MALDTLGGPFKGSIWYWVEASYGGGESAVTLPVSCKVQDVRIGSGDRHIPLRGIDSPLVCNLLKQTNEPTLHIEYIPQCDDTMIDDCVDRIGSCCELQSFAFCIGANTCEADSDDVSYFNVLGAKPETVRISGAKNAPYRITVDYQCQSITTAHTATGSAPADLAGAYLQFNVAGEIRKTGGHVVNTDHIAFITNSIDITVTHQLTPYTDHDALLKAYLVEGEMTIEGTCDISLDGGGAEHFGEVLANTAFEIEIDMGGAGCPRITLPGCQWKSGENDQNISGEAMMESAPFTAKPSSCTDIVTAVPA